MNMRMSEGKIARATLAITVLSFFSLVQLVTSPSRAFALNDSEVLEEPRITITSATKAGSFYSDDFTISGQVQGTTIKDAAIYVAGQRRSTLILETHHHNLKNNKFKITIDASEEPELRIITSSGLTLIEKIDVLDYRS